MWLPPACSVVPWICLNALFKVLDPVAGWESKASAMERAGSIMFCSVPYLLCCWFFLRCWLIHSSEHCPERINIPRPTPPWAPAAGLWHSSLKQSWDLFQSLCWFIFFLSFNFQLIYVFYLLGILYMSIMCQDVSIMYLDVSIMCRDMSIMYHDYTHPGTWLTAHRSTSTGF